MLTSAVIAQVLILDEHLEQVWLGSLQQLRLKGGSSLALQVGMSPMANIKLRKVSYSQLLLGEFPDNAESLQRL